MIRYLATRAHNYTMHRFLAGAGAALVGRVVPTDYEDVLGTDPARLDGDVWIFSDYDRMRGDASMAAARLWRGLAASGRRMLNHPTRSLRRHALLRRLHRDGINDFDSFHMTDLRPPTRYPLFLRRADAHSGPATKLLQSRARLDRTIDEAATLGWLMEACIAVEFQDTSGPDGLFRKYGVMNVAGRIFPVQVLTADAWINKRGTSARWTPDVVAAELDYFERNPHREALARIFGIAGIDYGRIDFGMTGDRMQVWEINCNPSFTGSTPGVAERAEATAAANAALVAALLALDAGAEAG